MKSYTTIILLLLLTISIPFLIIMIASYVILWNEKIKEENTVNNNNSSLSHMCTCTKDECLSESSYNKFSKLQFPMSQVASLNYFIMKNNISYFLYKCSGVILNTHLILTINKCYTGILQNKLFIRIGSNYWYKNGSVHKIVSIIYPSQNIYEPIILQISPKISSFYPIQNIFTEEKDDELKYYIEYRWSSFNYLLQYGKQDSEIQENYFETLVYRPNGFCYTLSNNSENTGTFGHPLFTSHKLHGLFTNYHNNSENEYVQINNYQVWIEQIMKKIY